MNSNSPLPACGFSERLTTCCREDCPRRHGFTLIEVIVYVALLGLFLSGAIVAAFALSDSNMWNIRNAHIQEEAAFMSQKILWALTNATEVEIVGDGVFIAKQAGEDFPVGDNPIAIYREDTSLMLKRNTREPLPLNAMSLPVEDFEAEIVAETTGKTITVRFQLAGKPFIVQRFIDTP